eukprot:714144-Pleurochrysis_carterae.AAC.1
MQPQSDCLRRKRRKLVAHFLTVEVREARTAKISLFLVALLCAVLQKLVCRSVLPLSTKRAM